jgi:long-chain acyl-CoA synthetase
MENEYLEWADTVVRTTARGHPCLAYERRPHSVGALLVASRRWSDRTFILHGARKVTFAAHEAAVRRASDLMASRGVTEGDRVGLLSGNCPEWSVAFFAAMELGAITTPLNSWWSRSEVEHACRTVEPTLVVADAKQAAKLPSGTRVLLIDELADVIPPGGASGDEPRAGGRAPQEEGRPAVILFTSGTTGFPKGATLSHRSLIANLQSLLVVSRRLPHQLADDHRAGITLTNLPLFHIGAIQLLLLPFVVGAELVFPEGRFDAGEVLRLIEAEQVTTWSAVPTMVERALVHPELHTRDTTSLRTVVMGGGVVSPGLLDRVAQAFPTASRGVGQSYGLSEAGGVLSTGVAKDLSGRGPECVGRIVPVAEIKIDQPDAAGVGEILARSPAVMDGYWRVADDSVFAPDGWLHTGDLGKVDDDGFLYVTGRSKDMIIRGGENIAPAHIEACLLSHPDVREAAVVGLPHPDLGEEVGAVVVVRPGATTTVDDLAGFIRPHLARFEQPERWWLRSEDLPKTDTGKIAKFRLREQWLTQPKMGQAGAIVG